MKSKSSLELLRALPVLSFSSRSLTSDWTLHWTPLHLFAILEHFQNPFLSSSSSSFLSMCPHSLSLWQCGETCLRISVNMSEVVPEFKSFTQRWQTQLGGVCVMERKIYLETDGGASVSVRGRKRKSWREKGKMCDCMFILLMATFGVFLFFTVWYRLKRADVHLRGCA